MNPYFFYGEIVKYDCNINKDRNKYRIRLKLFYDSGNTYNMQKGGFETKKQAEKARDVLTSELIQGTFCPFKFKLEEFLDYWLSTLAVSPSTFSSYTNAVHKYFLKYINGNMLLTDITIEMIAEAINQVKSDSIRRHVIIVVAKSFAYAYHKHYIPFNVSLAAIQIAKIKRPDKRHKRNIEWSVDQIKYALYICKIHYPDMFMTFLLSLTIGTRISETIALKYSDIDFTNCTIMVMRQIGKYMDANKNVCYGEKLPKTKNGIRKIPIPKWVIDEIIVSRAGYESRKACMDSFVDSDYICCHEDGSAYHRSSMNKWFKALLKECDMEDIHWHDLRHIYATTLKNNEINVKAISTYMGHSKPTFTESVYIAKKERINDCTILSNIWESLNEEETTDITEIPNKAFCKLLEEEKTECFTIPLQKSYDDSMHFEMPKDTYTEEIYEIPFKKSVLLLLDDSQNEEKEYDFFYDLTILEKCNII